MEEPTWQPIAALPLLLEEVETMLVGEEEQLATLRKAEGRPYSLDDDIVERVEKAYSLLGRDIGLFEKQGHRWRELELDPHQRRDVERFTELVARLRSVNDAILALAETLRNVTIERLLSMSDVEAGLDWLTSGAVPLRRGPVPPSASPANE